MPMGFGFYNGTKPVDSELGVLKSVQPGQIPTALTESAASAVRALAAANGVKQSKPTGGGGSATRDRLIILGVSLVALVAVLLFPAQRLRRRAQGAER